MEPFAKDTMSVSDDAVIDNRGIGFDSHANEEMHLQRRGMDDALGEGDR